MGKLSQIGTAYALEVVALAALQQAERDEKDGRIGAGDRITKRAAYVAAQAVTVAANTAYIVNPEAE